MIGQETAKKTLAVAVFNHYNRVRSNLIRQYEIQQQQQREENENMDYDKPRADHHHPTLPSEYYTSNIPTQSVGADLVLAERIPTYDKCIYPSL